MDNFSTFYLFVLITAPVILLYFSLKTIVLAVILVIAVWVAINVVNGSFDNQRRRSFPQPAVKGKKQNTNNKPLRSKSKGLFSDECFSPGDMPSTVKLTPASSRRTPISPILKNHQTSHSQSYYRTSFTNASISSNSFNQSLTTSPRNCSLSNKSFLPSVKRALGLSEFSQRENSLPVSSPKNDFPTQSSAGFIPAVRLTKRERAPLTPSRSSTPRSPNVVRIAPPDLHRLSSPRLFHIQTGNAEPRRPPDTQAVISKLKEKSLKRTYGGYDLDTSYTDYPVQQSKRRRQDSQHSNSSSSSLPPLPESLPDLASSGYTIPRLETPTLKRSALVDDWDESCSAKKLRKDGRINPILSSLSSSQRFAERDKQTKRKVSVTDNKENTDRQTKQAKKDADRSPLNRSDTVILPTESVDTPIKNTDKSSDNTSTGTPVSADKPKLDKRVTLNQSFSARKRQNSLYTALNKSFQKVPHANVIASMEDYESDMGAEKKRVQDMLEEIYIAETEKEKEKQKKEAEEKAKAQEAAAALITSNAATTGVSLATTVAPVLTVSSATGFSLPSSTTTSSVTSVSSTKSLSSNPPPFNFATVKSSSPQTSVQGGLPSAAGVGVANVAGSNTQTINASVPSISTGFSTSAPLSTASSTGSSTVGGFTLGNQASSASTTGFGATAMGAKTTTGAPFSFGQNITTTSSTSSSALPSYSAAVAPKTTVNSLPQPNISFGMQPVAAAPSQLASGFSFGQQPKTVTTTAAPAPSGATFTFNANTQTGSSNGQQPSNFGNSNTTSAPGTSNTASTFGFKSFGSVSQTTTTSSIFGGNPSVPSFGTSAPSFGTSATPAFGTGTSFGQGGLSATTSAPSGGFNFSAGTTSLGSQGPAAFGQTAAPAPNPFGTSGGFGPPKTAAQPAFPSGSTFGSVTTTSSTFGFGSTATTTAASNPFGQSTGTSTTPFGQTAPSFGASQNPPNPGFGTTAPSFGQPNFNTPTTTATAAPSGFGAANFSFGQPSANTFGSASTQPSGSKGPFAFGGAATTTTQSASSTFNFGATTTAPVTPNNKTGFNFSAAATPANNTGGGFDFSANASFSTPTGLPAPVFGTPTPGGAPNMFSVTPNNVPSKPRVAQSRTRRRGGGKAR